VIGILLGVPAYFAWQRWQRRASGPVASTR